MIIERIRPWFVPVLLLGASFLLRWEALQQTEYVNGWDGYFYLVQVQAMAEEGAMHSPDSSPVYGILYLLTALFGNGVLAFKVLCAGLAATIPVLIYMIVKRFSRRPALAFLAGALCVLSPSLTFYAAQFPKNLLGLNALLLLLYFLLGKNYLGQFAAFVLAFLSHRMTAGLSILFLLFQRINIRSLLVVLGMGIIGLAFSLLFPGLINIADLDRFEGAFQLKPALQGMEFASLLDFSAGQRFWMAEIIVAYGLFAWMGIVLLRDSAGKWANALFLLLLLLTFPFFSMDARGMGYRFFLSFMVLIPVAITFLPRWIPPIVLFSTGLILIFLGFIIPHSYQADRHDPDYALYNFVTKQLGKEIKDVDPELLIAHKGLAEMITYQSRIDALPWQPEYDIDSMRLWRIAYGIMPMEYRYYLSPTDHREVVELSLEYALVRENVWQRFVKAVHDEKDVMVIENIMDWKNPHEKRPVFLRTNTK